MRALLAGLLAGLLAASAAAREPETDAPPEPIPPGFEEDLRESLASEFPGTGGDLEALSALLAYDSGALVSARETAERLIARDARSVQGHTLLGLVLARGEGNLAGAAHHLERAVSSFEDRHGDPSDGTPWFWHQFALESLAELYGDMGRREDALEIVERLEAAYEGNWRQYTGWWLYRLGRFDDARALARSIIEAGEDSEARARGWNVLCAVEGDSGRLLAAYDACHAALREDRTDERINPVQLTNTAEAARALLRVDETEELLLEATGHFHSATVSIPWSELMWLYVVQGRLAEAVEAMRESQRWRSGQQAWVGALSWGTQDVMAAHLLLAAGYDQKATQLTRRAMEQPDRYGRYSSEPGEHSGWVSLLDRASNLASAERQLEAAASVGWTDVTTWGRARWAALGHRWRAWRSGRQAVRHFADRRLLESRLVPHASGRVPIPEWIELDLVELLGPGVIETSLRRLSIEAPPEGASAYAVAFAAEAAAVAGRHQLAIERAELAMAGLPLWERLLRARIAASAARAHAALGDTARAATLYDRAWQADPGVIRRQGHALPVRFRTSDAAAAREARRRLERSPRFARADTGFEVRIESRGEGLVACLRGLRGSVLRCADAALEAGEADHGLLARRLVEAFHQAAFAPRVDLTQADLRSLDGSSVVSGGADPQVRWVLDELRDARGAADGAAPDDPPPTAAD